jgi:DNA polymerase-1
MKRICVVDTSSLLHAAKHSIGKSNKLSYNERPTFVIYGFLFRLRSVLLKIKPDVVVFALDSQSSIRKDKHYSLYKSKRKTAEKTPEQKELDALAYPQFEIIQNEILPEIGYKNVFKVEGFEADDIIGSICKTYKDFEICIVTSDEDMYQCLRSNIAILKPRDYTFFTLNTLKEKYGLLHGNDWKRIKVYGGCNSDSVPGLPIPNSDLTKPIRHIGEKSAINYFQGKLKPHTNTYKAFIIPENAKIINRNKILTILPLKGTPSFKIVTDKDLSKKAFVEICKRFCFASILEDLDDFSSILKLK